MTSTLIFSAPSLCCTGSCVCERVQKNRASSRQPLCSIATPRTVMIFLNKNNYHKLVVWLEKRVCCKIQPFKRIYTSYYVIPTPLDHLLLRHTNAVGPPLITSCQRRWATSYYVIPRPLCSFVLFPFPFTVNCSPKVYFFILAQYTSNLL